MRRTTGTLLTMLILLGPTLSQRAGAQVQAANPAPVPTDEQASVRLHVRPKQTQVFVDGYYAGMAEDFGGIFSRLHTRIGEHEITLYLEGYRTLTQKVRLGRSTYLIKHDMVPLAAGEIAVKPTAAVAPPSAPARDAGRRRPLRPEAAPPYPSEPRDQGDDGTSERRGPREWDRRGGTMAIRVQPRDAEVFIDGERWQGPDTSRLVVDVAEGTHRVEVSKAGFASYRVNVQVRRGETTTVNVSLATSAPSDAPGTR